MQTAQGGTKWIKRNANEMDKINRIKCPSTSWYLVICNFTKSFYILFCFKTNLQLCMCTSNLIVDGELLNQHLRIYRLVIFFISFWGPFIHSNNQHLCWYLCCSKQYLSLHILFCFVYMFCCCCDCGFGPISLCERKLNLYLVYFCIVCDVFQFIAFCPAKLINCTPPPLRNVLIAP